jgi:hypothetical protein
VASADRYVLVVDSAVLEPDAAIDRLVRRLADESAGVAVASPFARGGRWREPSWWLRAFLAWTNRFLSLAAHAELRTLVGTVSVFERGAYERAVAACAGSDVECSLLLECRRQGIRIVEVPFDLKADAARATGAWGAALWLAVRRSLSATRAGLRYRPALWFAVPGLVPGPLPLVAALLFALHASVGLAAQVIAATLIVQYTSLAIFSWQATTFVAKTLRRRNATASVDSVGINQS